MIQLISKKDLKDAIIEKGYDMTEQYTNREDFHEFRTWHNVQDAADELVEYLLPHISADETN